LVSFHYLPLCSHTISREGLAQLGALRIAKRFFPKRCTSFGRFNRDLLGCDALQCVAGPHCLHLNSEDGGSEVPHHYTASQSRRLLPEHMRVSSRNIHIQI
jgi:hypothetical protein